MNGNLTDLDNNLLASDSYSGFDSYRTAAPTQPSKMVISGEPVSINLLDSNNQPKPRTSTTVNTEPTVAVIPRTAAPSTEPTKEVVSESTEETQPSMPIFGGGGGGATARQGGEEEEEVVITPEPKKILGLSPKMFYILLGIAGVGTYLYFRKK